MKNDSTEIMYVVGASEQPFERLVFMFVRAATPVIAATLFYNYLLRGDTHLPLLRDKSLETGWGRRFASWDENGVLIDDKEAFEQNVRKFFGDRQQYADRYLAYLSSAVTGESKDGKFDFPLEMKQFIFIEKHEFLRLVPLHIAVASTIPVLYENDRGGGTVWTESKEQTWDGQKVH